jgi:uncharacterized protein involved in exopolysaccharide biosynthesis
MLYEVLAKQYEVARIDEAKDPSVIQILDPAIEPETKFKPKRLVIVALAAVAGLMLAIIWAFVKEANARAMKVPQKAARWRELKALLGAR